jgi:hypothetical protein
MNPSVTELRVPDFSGKLLWVRVSRPAPAETGGILLEFPEFVDRSGTLFLSGRQPQYGNGRWSGYQHTSVAWGSVTRYVVFDSLDEYRLRLRRVATLKQ